MMNRRIAFVLAVIVLLGAIGGGGVLYRQNHLNQAARDFRESGMAAAARGDHVEALDGVGRYLQRFGQDSDPEALYVYAMARREVPLPNNRHTQQAIPLLRRVISLVPDHPTARQDLLKLYLQVGFGQETLTLAREILADSPDDLQALQAEATMLARLQRFDEALENSRRLAELDPEEVQNHFLVMQMLRRTEAGPGRVLEYAEEQFERDPQSARLQMVLSVAHDAAGNAEQAVEWAERAAEGADADPEFVSLLEGYLNRLGRYETALALLERTARQSDDVVLLRSLTRRQLEQGDLDAVMAILDEAPLGEHDASVIGLGALAAAQDESPERIEAIVRELEGRELDPIADAWAPVLRKMYLDVDTPAQDIAAACERAIQQDDNNPNFHFLLGLAYEQMGESARALSAWQRTVSLSPAWLEPLLRSANLLATMGRHSEASQLALTALNRAPTSFNVAVATAEILGAGMERLNAEDRQRLHGLVVGIQEVSPMEPRTLALQTDLMARQGDRGGAADRIQAALDHEGALPESVFVQLARVSALHDLGLEDACYARLGEDVALSPALALAQASHALEAGDPEAGLASLTEAANAAGNTLEWRAARAQYMEQMGDPKARDSWAEVAAAAEANPGVLRTVLASAAAWQDLELIERVIENLRTQTGERGITWRENKARWLLQSDPSERAAAEASVMLSEVIQSTIPRSQHFVLMAQALMRLDNEQGAIDNLEQAARLDPNSTTIRLELARLFEARGDRDRAAYNLDQAMRLGSVSKNDARGVAIMFARQGELARAIQLLLEVHPPEAGDTPADFLLAQFYWQQGDLAKAEAVLEQLLAEEPTVSVIALAADLLATQGRHDESAAVLAQLDGLDDVPLGERKMALAEYNRSHGDPATAKALYLEAVDAAPGNAHIWRRALGYFARNQEYEKFLELLGQARTGAPGDSALAAMDNERELVADCLRRPLALPLVITALESPEYLDEALQAMRIITGTPSDEIDRAAIQLRQLSDRYPRFLTLRMQLVRLYGAMERHTEAATLAMDAMRAFPAEIEPARLAAESSAAAGHWTNSLDAAEEWRRRSEGLPIDAALMIAEAQNRLDRPADALRTMQPYLHLADEDPAAFSPIHFQRVQALVRSNQFSEAAAEMEHRLNDSAQWRMAWIRLATTGIVDPEVTRTWYDTVAPHIPADAMDEQFALASGWLQLANRQDSSADRAKARTILDALAGDPDASGRVHLTLAFIYDQENSPREAEAAYRRALERDPALPVAANNLAMILIERNEDLDEAMEFAQLAVNAAPLNPSFLDTLAHVHAAQGDFDTAIEKLNRTVELDPDEPLWRQHLEEMRERKQESGIASARLSG